MKKQFLAIAAFALTSAAYGQVGINTATPGTTLDITAKNATGSTTAVDGLMIPRVDRLRAQSMSSIPTSTMIYVNDISTGAALGTAVNIDAVGFYYYDGTAWTKMGAGSGPAITASNGLTQASGNVQLGGALTQATTISGLTAANNLAFTGTGTNAFSIDGNTFSADAANHRIGLGTASPSSRLDLASSTAGPDDDVTITSNYGSTSSSSSLDFRRSTGSAAVPAAVTNGTPLGQILHRAYDGTTYVNTARYGAVVNGTVSSGSVPTDLYFSTGSTTLSERMRISSTGNVGISTTSPAATLDITAKNATGISTQVDGILIPRVTRERTENMTNIPTSTLVYVNDISSGSQTGVNANIDSVGFYYFNGTAWQKMGAAVYQNIAGTVNTLSNSTTSYTVTPSDYLIITTATPYVTVTFPTGAAATAAGFTAANAGKTVMVFNYNGNNTSGTGNSMLGLTGSLTGNNGGRTLVATWTGSMWIVASGT